jgi:hypothetical protein
MRRAVPLLLSLSALLTLGCQATTRPALKALDRSVVLGGQSVEAAALCSNGGCRGAKRVRFELGRGETVERPQPEVPYVHGGEVYVLPGDTFTVTGDLQGDRLVNLRKVADGEKPANRVTVRFGQSGDRENPLMVLLVESTLARNLSYQATVVPLGRPEHEPTSVCPVPAGAGTAEAWPFPIEALVMRELRLFDTTEQHATACR